MTAKQYIQEREKVLDTNLQNLETRKKKRSFLYDLGSVFAGVLGVCFLFGNPWFGIPCIGVAAALQMGKKVFNSNIDASISNYASQKGHLGQTLKNGINVSSEVNQKRAANIKKFNQNYKEKESAYHGAASGYNFANMLVAGTTALAWFIPGPLALVPIASLLVKKFADDKFMKAQSELQSANATVNNEIHDYNIANQIIARRGTATQRSKVNQPVQTNSRTNQAAINQTRGNAQPTRATTSSRTNAQPARTTVQPRTSAQTTRRISPEDQAAVDAYLRHLASQKQAASGTQKRKI